MYKILLILVLITAEGPRETQIEQESLAECFARASAITQKSEPSKMGEAGIIGYGAGCLVLGGPTQDAGND